MASQALKFRIRRMHIDKQGYLHDGDYRGAGERLYSAKYNERLYETRAPDLATAHAQLTLLIRDRMNLERYGWV